MWGKNSANVTDASAISVHGTNPQNLIEKILRSKIYNHAYWKEHCFGLTAESLVDKAMEIEAVGGTYGGISEPTHFIQLTLKMLQIQPEKEIVVEFIKNEDYKYVRALGAYYMRLTGRPVEVYQYLEPLYNDYRKLRRRMSDGSYTLTRMDEFVDECLRSDYLLDIALPHLPKRLAVEANGLLAGPRRSALEDDLEELEALEAQHAEPPPPAAAVTTTTTSGGGGKKGGGGGNGSSDTLKTKTQASASASEPSNPIALTKQIYKAEGIAGFYSGVSTTMAGQAIIKGALFFIYGAACNTLARSRLGLGTLSLCLAAGFSGAVGSLVMTPVERIKCVMQAKPAGTFTNPFACIAEVVRLDGVYGLTCRGLGATVLREIPACTFYLVGFALAKEFLLGCGYLARTPALLLAGAFAGAASWVPVYPVDVVKTQIQIELDAGGGETDGSFVGHAKRLWQLGGFGAFWDGLGPKLARAIVNHAVTFLVFDSLCGLWLVRWG